MIENFILNCVLQHDSTHPQRTCQGWMYFCMIIYVVTLSRFQVRVSVGHWNKKRHRNPKKEKKKGIAEIWKFAGIWKMLPKFAFFFFFCKIWPISLLLRSSLGCSGFRDANSPMSSFENGNLSPTDWTFSSGWNRIDVGQFGWVVGL